MTPQALTTVPFGLELQSLIDLLNSWGSPCRYLLMRVATDRTPAEMHEAAALTAMIELQAEIDSYATRIEEDTGQPWAGTRVRFEIADATSERVDLQDFVGPAWDLESARFLDPSEQGSSKNPTERNTNGWAMALADPPYSLGRWVDETRHRISPSELSAPFVELAEELFGGLQNDLAIRSWSTNWSSWFDAGHEWWGSFLWTVHRPGSQTIVSIAASTTD